MSAKRRTLVTTAMLAKLCGVSQGTVDRALHNRSGINPETREQILAVAKEYGYRPNIHAQSLVSGKSGMIGIVVFDLYNDYFSEMLMNLESAFCREGLYPLVMFSEKNPKREKECIETLYAMGADGLILCPVNGGEMFGCYLKALGIPVITVGNRVPGIPYVGVDNFKAMYDLTVQRISSGFRQLTYFAPVLGRTDSNAEAQTQRFLGFQAAAREAGIPYALVTQQPEDVRVLCPNRETAVVASTDHYALRLVYAGVPADQLSGFDHIKAPDRYRVPLVTVDGNSVETARAVVRMFTQKQPLTDYTVPYTIVIP